MANSSSDSITVHKLSQFLAPSLSQFMYLKNNLSSETNLNNPNGLPLKNISLVAGW